MMAISVFLVDDHAVVRDGLRVLLESQPDIDVVGDAADGRSAIQQIEQLEPDIVLMDIAMPEMNGIEATYEIRHSSSPAQVVILSMYATSEHIFRAFDAGASGYLLKESAGAEVVSAIREVAAGRLYLSQKISEKVVEDYLRRRREASVQSPLELLSPREREVLQLVAEGKSSVEIAELLFLSTKTVETYRHRLMQKLNIGDIPSLVKFAIRHGLISLE
jgi:DNA-binding NarL/FixJ family response regulator